MSKSHLLLFWSIITLAASAAGLLLLAQSPAPSNRRGVQDFQRLVGGIGFGPTLGLDGCEFGYDPRLCPGCSQDGSPIPGGMLFCPHHAGLAPDNQPPWRRDSEP
jgi:hypothetical protein